MAADIHTMLARAGFALVGLLVTGLVAAFLWYTHSYELPPGTDIFQLAAGDWAWSTSDSGCAGETHRITFSADHRTMTIAASRPYRRSDGQWDSVAVYDILAVGKASIRGAIRGEERLTSAGVPVVWDLVLRGRDRYAWHRTDWETWAYTASIRRCAA